MQGVKAAEESSENSNISGELTTIDRSDGKSKLNFSRGSESSKASQSRRSLAVLFRIAAIIVVFSVLVSTLASLKS